MSNRTSVTGLINDLEVYFSKLNDHYYGNQLLQPIITVSPDSSNRAYGWCTSYKAWKEEKETGTEGYYEINICADYLNRPFEEVIGTLMHEMVHLWCNQNNIKDTSRSGTYHNKKFKDAAESHGLVLEKDAKYGWIGRALNEEAQIFVSQMKLDDLRLSRPREGYIPASGSAEAESEEKEQETPKKRKQSTRRYICPKCGMIVRATKIVRIKCIECDEELLKED